MDERIGNVCRLRTMARDGGFEFRVSDARDEGCLNVRLPQLPFVVGGVGWGPEISYILSILLLFRIRAGVQHRNLHLELQLYVFTGGGVSSIVVSPHSRIRRSPPASREKWHISRSLNKGSYRGLNNKGSY